jgi:zinc/manganese transport system substrate-binding protein
MKTLLIIGLLSLSILAEAKIKVVTTTPDLAWLVKELGKDKVEVTSLLNGTEDPHYVDAMPHWISKVSNADVFCFVGMDLEVGWAPKILSRSANAKVQSGGKGHCNAGKTVAALDIPTGNIDRSMGDIHGGGNPHYHLGPTYFLQAADSVFSSLVDVDSKNTEAYVKNLEALTIKINAVKKKVGLLLKGKSHLKIISYHKEFSYFFKDFNLSGLSEIEETPGVPPSAGRIARVALNAKKQKIDLAIATNSNPKKILNKFFEISKVPVAIVALSLREIDNKDSYEKLIVSLAKAILEKTSE